MPHRATPFAPQGEPIPNINTDINTDIPPNTRYLIGYDKETSYGTEVTESISSLSVQVTGASPTGGEAAAADSKKNKTSDIPFEDIREAYNATCASLPKCRTVTDKRKAAIRARWKEGFRLSDFEEAFKIAQASDFLKGQIGNRHWKADFDYLISPKMVKVLEGAYGGDNSGSEIRGYEDGSDGSYKLLGEYEF